MKGQGSRGAFAALMSMVVLCAAQANSQGVATSDQVRVDGTSLRLEENHERCSMTIEAADGTVRSADIELPWPCTFHKDKEGEVRVLRAGGLAHVLVEHSVPLPGAPKDCDTALRSVRIKGPSVEVSPHTERVASCPPFQWDAIVFTELFD